MFIDRFKSYIKENELFTAEDKVLLTVSGGVDSMVMLSLFVSSGYNIAVAHCNFQLRGDESQEDELLVENEAKRYGVPFYNKRFDTKAEIERTGESVQMVARRLRYEWFNEIAINDGCKVIAIAHHADDSIETFFINLMRGTGLKGLTGIHNVVGKVVRPMLFASRKDILDYAHINKIPFREDSSNSSTKYLRNKIRLGLIPRIREINSRFTELMVANVNRLTEAQRFIARSIEIIRQQVEERTEEGQIVIHPDKIDREFPVGFVIYEILRQNYGFKGDVVDSLCKALASNHTGKRFYARDYVAYVDRGRIIVEAISENDSCSVYIDKGTNRIYCGNSVLFVEVLDIDNVDVLKVNENVALLDADKVEFPLEVRKWREGDSFIPFGMSGRKKVSDFLIDAKVSMSDKRRQFVLTNGDDIVWLVGKRISDQYKIEKKTESVLKIVKETL